MLPPPTPVLKKGLKIEFPIKMISNKRKKVGIGDHNTQILISFWKRGMTGYGDERKKELLQQAVLETGLQELQVKDWIGNYRKRQAGKQYPKYGLKKKPPSGYNMFISEYVSKEIANGTPRNVAMSNASNVWKMKKSSGEDVLYSIKAQEMKPPTEENMTDTQKRIATSRLVKEIEAKIEALEKLGVEAMSLILVPATGKLVKLGTTKAIQFLQINDTEIKFTKFASSETDVNAQVKPKLKKDVQKLFNDKFFLATGRPHVSYKEVESGMWKVTGLPEGVKFKRPSCYGVSTLVAILEQQEITFSECSAADSLDDLNGRVEEERLNEREEVESLNEREEEERLNEREEVERLNEREEVVNIPGGSEEEVEIPIQEERESDIERREMVEVTDLEQLCGRVGVDMDNSGVYEVEEVIKKRKHNRKTQYLVKWAGFAECTWEPYQNIPLNLRKLKK